MSGAVTDVWRMLSKHMTHCANTQTYHVVMYIDLIQDDKEVFDADEVLNEAY